MTLAIEDFSVFFEAVNDGNKPFDWQIRLANTLATTGHWPDAIDAPTGTGKSSVIDIHLFVQALMGLGASVRAPRRLVVTVNRRALVDNHWEHAHDLREIIGQSTSGIVAQVRDGLRKVDYTSAMHHPGPSFQISKLRGGELPSREWVNHPAAPQVICATPDMLGSRLLFGGYGARPYARPREAGLLAFDTVIVLDEAHLNHQLVKTCRRIGDLTRKYAPILGSTSVQTVEMTATPERSDLHCEGVRPEDLVSSDAASLLQARLCRPKPVDIIDSTIWPMKKATAGVLKEAADMMANKVMDIIAQLEASHSIGSVHTVGCIVNTVTMALKVSEQLSSKTMSWNQEDRMPKVVTLVGRMRPFEWYQYQKQYPGLFSLKGDPSVDIVVATQTVEVGANMNFIALVTELAPGTALAQRAGRVNRAGALSDGPIHVIIPFDLHADLTKTIRKPYQLDELLASEPWLRQCANLPDGLSSWNLHPQGGGLTPPPASPRRAVYQRVEPWDINEWSRTSDDLIGEPWLDLWLADDLEPDTSLGIVVRQGLPIHEISAVKQIKATPPLNHEVFPVMIEDVGKVLQKQPRVFLIRNEEVTSVPMDGSVPSFRPGDLIVLDNVDTITNRGVIVNPEDADRNHVADVGERDTRSVSRRWLRWGKGTPLADSLGDSLMNDTLKHVKEYLNSSESEDEEAEIFSILSESLNTAPNPEDELVQLGTALLSHNPDLYYEPILDSDLDDDFWIVVRGTDMREQDPEMLQISNANAQRVELDCHQQAVADEVDLLAQSVGISPDINLALVQAATLHDEGKRDARFQRSLRWRPQDAPGVFLAKSGIRSNALIRQSRERSGLPPQWRHEQLSAAVAWAKMAYEDANTRDLVARLVGTTHGRGRHEFPQVGCDAVLPTLNLVSEDNEYADSARALFDEGEWECLLERTDNHYGVYGCAYLEALVRAADTEVSRSGS